MPLPIDWLWGLAGGLMIGLSAAIYLLFNGRIMGASGIIGSLVDGTARENAAERKAFLLGLVLVPGVIVWLFAGGSETNLTPNLAVVIVAGLLVGIGTRIANGCTSGHGVCGISRLNFRGIVATVFYIVAGGVTIILFKHVLGVIG